MIELPALYDHQATFRDAIRASLVKHRESIACAPPGCGKTRIAKHILGMYANREVASNQSGHALFAVHRRGLVDNAANSFAESPLLPHRVVMSGRKTENTGRVHVASIDTLNSWFVNGNDFTGFTFDLIVYDECVAGDSVIDTNLGRMRIDEVPTHKPSHVRSYSESKGAHFAKILNWTASGVRDTIALHTHMGCIQCTPDHLVFTRFGWLEAQFVSHTDEILVCVAAGKNREEGTSSLPDTSHAPHTSNCPTALNGSIASPRHANAVVDSKRARCTPASRHGLSIARRNFGNMPLAMKTAQAINCLNSRLKNDKPFSARCLATPRLATPTTSLAPHVLPALTGFLNSNGLNTRQNFCTGSIPKRRSSQTLAGANALSPQLRRAIQHSLPLTVLSNHAARRLLPKRGWMRLAKSALHGGFVTMVPLDRKRFSCTQRGFHWKRMNSLPIGSATISGKRPLSTIAPRICASSTSPAGRNSKLEIAYGHTSQTACNTSWCRVTRIENASPVAVYDIEVDTSHCFFANNLLVHNCHAHLPSLRSLLKPHNAKRKSAGGLAQPFILGLSATPQHKELNEVFKDIVYGPKTQWLIDNGFLSPFRYFHCTPGDLHKLVRHGDDYTESSVADAMSSLAGHLVNDWKTHADGRATVGFFPRKSHAQEAVELLLAAGIVARYVDCDTPDDERREMFADLNEGRIQYIANVGIVERGTDIPRIGCVQMCTAVGNVVRWKQMIGRGSRVHPAVQDCIVLDHADNVRRLGFFEDEVMWSLNWGDRPAKTHETRASIQCPSCGQIYRGGQCRKCGYEPNKRERKAQGLDFIGGELVEITKADKKPPNTQKTNEQLLVAALYACARSNRTFRQAIHIARSAAEKQGTTFEVPASFTIAGHSYKPVPRGNDDGSRNVASVYGVLVKNYSSEFNPYRVKE